MIRRATLVFGVFLIFAAPIAGAERYAIFDLGPVRGAETARPPADSPIKRVVIHQEDRTASVDSLVPAGSNWRVLTASVINDAGQILGVGVHNGETRMFLLAPVASLVVTRFGRPAEPPKHKP